uniref:Papilin n=1 Tax=Ascaris suum TaxID=6253 RepID=F1KQ30_ASCSU
METFTPNSPMQTTHPVEPLAPLISKQDIGTPAESLLPENRCIHARDPGDCNGQFVRWYWDSNVKMCEVFTYTGCNGNGNNFASREECISVCHREDALPAATKVEQPDLANVCEHEVDAGECKGEFQRFAFDAKLGECRAFVYGGCGGNGNNFASITDCQRKCHSEGSTLSTNVCEHPIEVGECSGVFARFAYDSVANECRQFTYGGCGGNGNNFATLADCRTLCVKVKCPPEPRCDLTRCQLVNDAQGCPFCSCPPPHQPHPPTAEREQHPSPLCSLGADNLFSCSGRPIERPDCPPLDVMLCIEPCIIFSNRRGCQECVCPVIPPNNVVEATNSIIGPVSPTGTLPTVQTDRPPSPPSSPAAPSSAAPPASVSMPAQPPRQASVPILKSFDKGPLVSQQQAEKPRQPYPLTPASRIPNIADLGEKCTQPLDAGPCKNFTPRWYFNVSSTTCEQFDYGGCAGNRNHFFSKNECEIHCGRFARAFAVEGRQPAPQQPIQAVPQRQEQPAGPLQQTHAETITDSSLPGISQQNFQPSNFPSPLPLPLPAIRAAITSPQSPQISSTTPSPSQSSPSTITLSIQQPTSSITTTSARQEVNANKNTQKTIASNVAQSENVDKLHQLEEIIESSTQFALTESEEQEEEEPTEQEAKHPPKQFVSSSNSDEVEIFGPPLRPPIVPHKEPPRIIGASPSPIEIDEETCVLPPEAGPCVDYVPRWFYNSQTGNCEQFSYGSCGGNTNNFMDRQTCEAKCQSGSDSIKSQVPDRCTHEKDEGYGGGYNVKWYFNIRNLRCEQMVYQGEGGNDNQFSSLGDCQTSCVPVEGIGFSPKPVRITQPTMSTLVAEEEFTRESVPRSRLIMQKKIDHHHSASNRAFHGTVIAESVNEYGQIRESAPSLPIADKAHKKIHAHTTASATKKTEVGSTSAVDSHGPELASSRNELNTAESISSKSEFEYNTELLNKKPLAAINSQMPILAPSPPMKINYQNGVRINKAEDEWVDELVEVPPQKGLEQILSGIEAPVHAFGSAISEVQRIPVCPNGLKAIQSADGKPVMCLPGKNHCPGTSSCYFNGIDFFCCPNEEDPYDKHVFGGYNGDEERHGYKSLKSSLNIRSLADEKIRRVRRAASPSAAFSLDLASHPARFDAKAPRQYTRASLRRPAKIDPCTESVDSGSCNEAHLRYFYDRRADTCRLFYYSGCSGNSNNFATQYECEQRCKVGRLSSRTTPPGTCPGGRPPLGENAPVLCGNQTDSIGCPAGYYCRNGPPDVCCPNDALDFENVRKSNKKSKSKPRINAALIHHGSRDSTENVVYGVGDAYSKESAAVSRASPGRGSAKGTPSEAESSPMSTPPTMCPDGSDALLDESSGLPLKCGSGFDGQALCPVGFYCSIDSERNGRLCCPLGVYGSNIPPPPVIAPYLGLRRPNPGEVIDRGSLLSDPKPPRLTTPKAMATMAGHCLVGRMRVSTYKCHILVHRAPYSHAEESMENTRERGEYTNESDEGHASELTSSENEHGSAEAVEENVNVMAPTPEGSLDGQKGEGPYGRMLLKPTDKQQLEVNKAYPGGEMKSAREENDGVQIDIGEGEDPFESDQLPAKKPLDRSACHLKPTEGRPCHENETAPKTNLQYFYSRRDRKCKLYFYRGCGGNANRFEKKRDCETLCMGL